MKTKFWPIVFKLAFTAVFIGVFYIQKERDMELMAEEDRQKFAEEFEACEDALEENLRPLIERNKLVNARNRLDTLDTN